MSILPGRGRKPLYLVLAALLASPAGAYSPGYWDDGIWIPATDCVYAKDCESSSSSSSSSPGFTRYSGESYYGKQTANTLKNCKNPVCMVLLVPLCVAADAPFWVINGLKVGFHYGAQAVAITGRGVGRGLAAVGRGAARASKAPFDRSFKLKEPASTWEQYKRDMLAYQKWATKQEPSNKENLLWCKTRIPLEVSPNRAGWEARCNPKGVIEHTAAVSRPVNADEPAERLAKTADCAVAETLWRMEAGGAEGQALAGEVRAELKKVLAELKDTPPSGKDGDIKIFTSGKNYAAKSASGEQQTVVNVTIQRDEKTGEVHIDALTSVKGADGVEHTAQNILILDAAGNITSKEATEAAQACLKTPSSRAFDHGIIPQRHVRPRGDRTASSRERAEGHL